MIERLLPAVATAILMLPLAATAKETAATPATTAAAADALAKPGTLDAATGTISAKVEAIDYKTRTITLRGEQGNVLVTTVGPEVTRFDDIKKGDLIEVEYFGAIAVSVQPAGKDVASVEGGQTIIVRNQGKKPSGVRTDTDIVTATVEKIDAKKRSAVLVGPEGNKLDINIAEDVPNIENIKKGDRVVVRVTRSVAIAVHKPD